MIKQSFIALLLIFAPFAHAMEQNDDLFFTDLHAWARQPMSGPFTAQDIMHATKALERLMARGFNKVTYDKNKHTPLDILQRRARTAAVHENPAKAKNLRCLAFILAEHLKINPDTVNPSAWWHFIPSEENLDEGYCDSCRRLRCKYKYRDKFPTDQAWERAQTPSPDVSGK